MVLALLSVLMLVAVLEIAWPAPTDESFHIEDVNWEDAAACIFLRYDNAISFGEQGRILQFCVEVEQAAK